ncbi:MAG: sulfide/dihydroorotate dehydrogenase-like FAD/NAD-binding protein [Candidatus Eisenbacteria bacterium]|uniref:Sulfide/dihydroorotate dehydrogenase-like FAD/NAD-binding protein n=1 Tax=Eiseniibacteriota bacterium TaxID=2212470 RepID=A0A948W610_UNCEI|nr:sulfide/dihydroorotate dehydrogenase-like FAD/NAD-binding protein [Candidatus Eisenbacteria bacterium]MBU1951256.1 sulfide/dihydroorotate dehydrogenase-like FAD/NAD-binding protein [Candidatus Eisenbacteria bacterium]MBU2691014.1 sulfide/dihydroorotate dehydrogenase-like FAD/NAD-binding protein [Candidatus Eisenbacteria bacterium]
MHKILKMEVLGPAVFRMVVEAAQIARKRKAGQFIILSIDEYGERIPLTIADADSEAGTITLIFQVVGKTTTQLSQMKVGDVIENIVGPLGKPTHIENFGTVVCIGGGIGIAPLFPITQALKKAGNKIITILGARSKDLLILENEMKAISDETIVTTDDGSYGEKALVTGPLQRMIDAGERIDFCVAIGPAIMMKFVSKTTEPYGIPTFVSINTIMIDGTGMCGGCRVSVGGETKFACVDGPEFDGHKVDFDELTNRLHSYNDEESKALKRWNEAHGEGCRMIRQAENLSGEK